VFMYDNQIVIRPVNTRIMKLSSEIITVPKDKLSTSLCIVYANYTSGYIHSPLFVDEKYLPIEVIKLNNGDVIGVPFSANVIDVRNLPQLGQYVTINQDGKYCLSETSENTIGKVIMITSELYWLLINFNFTYE